MTTHRIGKLALIWRGDPDTRRRPGGDDGYIALGSGNVGEHPFRAGRLL